MTIAILIKLLLINIVANNFLGISLRYNIRLLTKESSFFRVITSFDDNEKKATSDPEIKAEATNKDTNESRDTDRLNNGSASRKRLFPKKNFT